MGNFIDLETYFNTRHFAITTEEHYYVECVEYRSFLKGQGHQGMFSWVSFHCSISRAFVSDGICFILCLSKLLKMLDLSQL